MPVALTYRASCDALPDRNMPPQYMVEITVESPFLSVARIEALNTDTPTPADANESLSWKRTSDRGLENLRVRVNNELMALTERNIRCAQEHRTGG